MRVMLNEQLRALRKKAGLTQVSFARAFNVANGTVAMWETGKRQPDIVTLQRIAAFFGVGVDVLIGNDPQPDGPPASTGGKWIPVLGRVAAGVPIEAAESILGYEEITLDMAGSGEHFALKVQGDSMEPRIAHGDVVIVRQQSDAESGDIAVVLVNGCDATVKRIKKRPDGLMLIPNNQAHEPMFYNNTEIAALPVQIIGKVVELRGKFE